MSLYHTHSEQTLDCCKALLVYRLIRAGQLEVKYFLASCFSSAANVFQNKSQKILKQYSDKTEDVSSMGLLELLPSVLNDRQLLT